MDSKHFSPKSSSYPNTAIVASNIGGTKSIYFPTSLGSTVPMKDLNTSIAPNFKLISWFPNPFWINNFNCSLWFMKISSTKSNKLDKILNPDSMMGFLSDWKNFHNKSKSSGHWFYLVSSKGFTKLAPISPIASATKPLTLEEDSPSKHSKIWVLKAA